MTSERPPGPLKNVVLNVKGIEPILAVAEPVPTTAFLQDASWDVCAASRAEALQLLNDFPLNLRCLSSEIRMSLTAGGWLPSVELTTAERLRVPALGLALVPGLPE